MNRNQAAWQRLTTAARSGRDERDATAPFGFATRVATLGFSAGTLASPRALMEKFALRGFFAAGAFSLAAVAFGFTAINFEQETETTTDAVSEVLAES